MEDGQLVISMRVTLVVVPVALYFLVLGLFNSRQHPYMVRAQIDFALLAGAISPLLVIPVAGYFQWSPWAVVVIVGLLAAVGRLMAPRGHRWVIYNISRDRAMRLASRAMEDIASVHSRGDTLCSDGNDVRCRIRPLPLFRSVGVQLQAPRDVDAAAFERRMAELAHRVPAQTSPAVVSMLLVAMAMLVVPASLVARHTGQLVRILSDLLR